MYQEYLTAKKPVMTIDLTEEEPEKVESDGFELVTFDDMTKIVEDSK
jgi:UDP-N-acetylglucosamine 2-epimerase